MYSNWYKTTLPPFGALYKDITSGDFSVGDSKGFSQRTHIPGANFRRALLSYNIVADSDNTILNYDAIAVDTLRLGKKYNTPDNEKIRNLTGIEAFTAFTYLGCGGNQLMSLDVSANTVLTQLQCDNNQLSTLNVSTPTSATLAGNILSDGGSAITGREFVYSSEITEALTIENTNAAKITSGTGIGVFSENITDLMASTIYYYTASNFQFPISTFQLSILNFHLPTSNFQLPVSNFHLHILQKRDRFTKNC